MEEGGMTENAPEITEKPWWSEADRQARVLMDNRRIRDNDIKPMLEMRSMLVGPHFGGGLQDVSREKPTNTVYGFYSRVYSQVMGGDLKCVIETDHGSPEEPIALRHEPAINRTFEQAGGHDVVELVLADMVCGYGALMVTPPEEATTTIREAERERLHHPLGRKAWKHADAAPRTGVDQEAGELLTEPTPITDASPRQPGLMYLPPNFWSYDRRAYTIDQCEFFEYQTTHNIDELIHQAKADNEGGSGKWHIDKLRHARTSISESDKHKIGGQSVRSGGLEADTERDRITLTNLIVMNAKIDGEDPPKNHNAVTYTLWTHTDEVESAIWVREPYYTFVPPFGPFALFYQHMTGVDSLPFSVLTANKTKVEASDDIHAVAFRRIREYKSNPVFDVRDAADVQALEGAPDGQPIGITGENGLKYENVVRGGLDPVIVNAIQYFDQRLAEDLGFDSAARGAAQGGGVTATETDLAASQSNMRVQQFQKAFNRGMAQVYRAIGWYIGHDSRFFVRADFRTRAAEAEAEAVPMVGAIDAKEVGRRAAADPEKQGLVQGGDFAELDDFDFNELRHTINSQVQSAITPEARRMESAQLRMEVIQLMQVAAQFPLYDWVSELRQLEEDYGRRGLVDSFKPEIASMMAQANIEGGQTAAVQTPTAPGQRDQSGPRVTVQNARPQGPQETLSRGAARGQGAGGPFAGPPPQQ